MATTNETRIVLTASDQTKGAFDSAARNLGALKDKAAEIDRSVVGLGANFAALGGAIAGALSISAVKNVIDVADELDHLAQKTGIAVESLSALRYAGEIAGTPMESLATGVRKLSQNMAEAAGGAKEQGEVFKALGLSVKDMQGNLLPADQMLGAIADKFAGYQDGTGKAALAMQVFGKAGADLIPLLNAGSAGIADLTAEAQKLGVVFGGDLSGPAAEFNDNLTRLKFAGEGFGLAIAQQVLPTMVELTQIMADTGGEANGLASVLGAGLKTTLETVAVLAADVSFVLKAIGREAGAIAAQMVALASLDINGFNAISAAVKEDAVKARAELDALQNKILGFSATFSDPRILGSVGTIAQQTAAWKALAPVVAKAGDSAKKTADEFARLYDKITGKGAGIDADFYKNLATLKDGLDKGRIGLDDYVKAVEAYIKQQPFAAEAAKAATKAMEDQAMATYKLGRAELDEAEAIDAWRKQQNEAAAQLVKSIDDRVTALQDEEAAVAMAAQQNISLALAIEQVSIQRLREQQAVLIAGSDAYDNIQKEIEARERLLGVMNTADLRERETKGWAQVFQSVDDTAHEAWTNVWQSGTDAFKRIGQTLKASVLDVLYQMTVRPFIVQISASVLGGGFATAANAATGSGSSVLGIGGSASNLLSSAGNLAGLFGAGGLSGSLAAGAGWLTGATTLGGSLSAGASLIGTGTAGSLAGAGMIAGALAPIGIALAGVYALAKNLDHSGTPHTGGGSQYSAALGLQTTANASFQGGFTGVGNSAGTIEFTSGIVQSVVGILDSTAVTFGKTAGYQAASSFADDSSKDGAWGSLVITKLGDKIVDWADSQSSKWAPKVFSDGTAGNNEYLAAVSTDVRAALDAFDLPAWASGMLDALGDAPALDQLAATVAQINATQTALAAMGESLAGFADLSDAAVQSLIAASGGIDKLSASASSYYQNFYSEEERLANTRRQTMAALGDVGVDTSKLTDRSSYRAYVEYLQSIVDTEPAAAGALAVMLDLNDEFASFVPAVESVADAVDRTASDISNSIAKLKSDTTSLQVELLAAQGDTTGAAALQRAIDTAGFTDVEIAIYDYNAALRAQIDSINDAAEAESSYYQNFYSEEERLANVRKQTFAALGDVGVDTSKLTDRSSYRAYVEYLQSIVDTEPAAAGALAVMLDLNDEFASFTPVVESVADAVDRTASDISNSIAKLKSDTTSLQVELLAAQGDTTGAAALQRAIDTAGFTDVEIAIYDYNAALRAQIDSINDAAEAERSRVQERTGIENTLLGLLGETDTLRQRELDALDPTNRALQGMVYAVKDAQTAIGSLTADIARLDQIATQASTLSNSISVALGGPDNTEANLWSVINDSTASAEDRLGAVGKMIGIINTSIATDTADAQRILTTGAQETQRAAQAAVDTQTKVWQTQLENAEKMLDLGKQLRDYVQGLRIGNLSALTPAEKLALAASAYNKSLSGAQAGDAEAMASLQGNASTYLEQARQFDPGAYTGIFASVTGTLDQFGGNLLTEGQQAQATAQAQLDQLTSISGASTQTTAAVLTGNVISDANRTSLETLLGITTDIEADAVIERADKKAQLTLENERMEDIRASLADDGVIATSSVTTASVMTSFAVQQANDNATLISEIQSLNARIAQLETTLVSATGAQIETAVTVGNLTAQAVSTAVSVAVDSAATAPVVA